MYKIKYLVLIGFCSIAGIANAATLTISPSSQNLSVGDTININIILDTQGVGIDGVDLNNLNYNPSMLQFQGSQVTPGVLMATTTINTVDTSAGKITFSQVASGGVTYTGKGNLVSMTFKALAVGTSNLNFDYSPGSTIDTNVASNGVDVLTAVINGQFIITVSSTTPSINLLNTTPTTTPLTQETNLNLQSLKLINSSGTFYLIQNGQRKGITNSGMLFTYGFEFKDGKSASNADMQLPEGSLLLPEDGALVKSVEDKTVYLISRGQRYGFVSESVFKSLGFKFSSVLVVTNPELQALTLASNLSEGSAMHLPGLDININGTIYYVNIDGKLYAYPSIEVYNSWHIDNDFTRVVPANNSDNAMIVGGEVGLRKVE